MRLDIERFASWTAFVDACAKAVPQVPKHDQQSRNADPFWSGSASFDEAIQVCQTFQWKDAQDKARAMSDLLINRVSSLIAQNEITYDVEGQTLDIAAYLSGEPECWQRPEEILVDGPGTSVHRLVFNLATSSGINAATMAHKGTMIATMVNLLERCGHRVEVVVCLGTSTVGKHNPQVWHNEVYITVKEASQPLDLDRIVVAMAYPSVLRRLEFALFEGWTDEEKRKAFGAGSSYGYPITGSEKGDLVIEASALGSIPDDNDLNQCANWLIEQLKTQGISIQGAK